MSLIYPCECGLALAIGEGQGLSVNIDGLSTQRCSCGRFAEVEVRCDKCGKTSDVLRRHFEPYYQGDAYKHTCPACTPKRSKPAKSHPWRRNSVSTKAAEELRQMKIGDKGGK